MTFIQSYLTKNPCYKANKTIAVQGLMLHSVGCPQPNPLVFIKNWDKESYNSACVHGFIGDSDVYITLPLFETSGTAHRGWHGGKGKNGSVNNTHIGIEMCEPSNIKYGKGASFTCSNYESARQYVEKTTHNAVILFAELCKFHKLDPLKAGVIISHAEGGRYGIASGHADPEHLWSGLRMSYNMDKFRQDVYNEMMKYEGEEEVTLDQFKDLWQEMRKELQDNDASAYSAEARAWATSSGLIQGNGTTINGEPNCMWADVLTREQMITIFYRFAQMMGKA